MKSDVLVLVFDYVYDGRKKRCIESLKDQNFSGSIDYKLVKALDFSSYFFERKIIGECSCKYLFFCDSMSILSKDCIDDLVKTMENNKSACAASYILHYDGLDYKNGGYYEKTAFGKMYKYEVFKEVFTVKEAVLSLKNVSRQFVKERGRYERSSMATVYENRIEVKDKNKIEEMEMSILNELSGIKLNSLIKRKSREGKVGVRTIAMSALGIIDNKMRRILSKVF